MHNKVSELANELTTNKEECPDHLLLNTDEIKLVMSVLI